MSTDGRGAFAYGVDLGVNNEGPDWIDEIFEEESKLPEGLVLVHYGKENQTGTFVALEKTQMWVWDTQPKMLVPAIRDLMGVTQEPFLAKELEDLLKQIEGYETPKGGFKVGWTLLASYG